MTINTSSGEQALMLSHVGRILFLAISVCIVDACSNEPPGRSVAPEGRWVSLFNGRNLDDWIVKIRGRTLDDDPANTFRVQDGVLRVDYSDYRNFGTSSGMLIYKQPLSRYWLRVEYRFVGEQPPGAPAWAFRDSGIQFHGQTPESIALDQEFPVGLEFNLIGGKLIGHSRPTGDVCTSGTKVQIDNFSLREECGRTSTVTIRMPDRWVRAEIKVDGDSIEHWIDGQKVAQYSSAELDERNPLAKALLDRGVTKQLREGYLSLQSNGSPVEFRKIEILLL